MITPAAMFSVALIDSGAETGAPQWLVTCDRCGCEIEANAGPASVLMINPPDSHEFRLRLAELEAARSFSRAIIIDREVEERRLDHTLRAHAKICQRRQT